MNSLENNFCPSSCHIILSYKTFGNEESIIQADTMGGKVDIEGLLKEMTLEEKVKNLCRIWKVLKSNNVQISLLAGKNFWETVGIERLGIPSLKVVILHLFWKVESLV